MLLSASVLLWNFYVPTIDLELQELNLTRCETVSPAATSPKEIPLVGIFTKTTNAACDQISFQVVPRLQQGKRKIRQTSKKSQHWLDTSHIEIIDGSDQIVGTNSKHSSFKNQ